MRYTLLTSLFTLASAQIAAAATISVLTQATGHYVASSTGGQLPVGSIVRVGYFNGLTDAQIFSARDNYSTLNAAFIEFGQGTVGLGTGAFSTISGRISFTLTGDNNPSGPPDFTNKPIYVWVFNQTSLPSGSDYAPGTEIGIFRNLNVNNDPGSSLTFPVGSTPGVDDNATFGFHPTRMTPAEIVVGTSGVGPGLRGPTSTNFNLAVVIPEPGVLAFTSLLIPVLLRRRR